MVRLDVVAEGLGLNREQLLASIRGLEDRGFINWQPPERIGGIELLDPLKKLLIDDSDLQRRRERELEKITQMMEKDKKTYA